ncbi:MAG: hypothetical protein OXD37_08515 [Acidimicrobiaceae bacterium]|nr:hypothetical protein [Acidimicrobiaceae bacterium]
MFLWFVACAVVLVALVFDSSGVDYRFVALGAVLPLVENLTGSPWLMHTLAGSAAALFSVMISTAGRGRRLRRRRWIGMPIAMLVFLVASGAWSRTELFWWPFAGGDAIGRGAPPEYDRPLVILITLELAGLAALLWIARRHGLTDPQRRRTLLSAGRLTLPQIEGADGP